MTTVTTHSQVQDTAPWSLTLSSLGTWPSCANPGARWCAGPTCLQEDGGEVQRPEAQVAILGAHGAHGPGDAEAADGNAGAWVGGAGSVPSSRAPPPAQQGPPTQTEGLLLCKGVTGVLQGQETASMPHGHALVVDLQDVATAAAHVAAGERQVRAVGTTGGAPGLQGRGRGVGCSQSVAILGWPEGQVGELQRVMLPQVHSAGAQRPTSEPPQPHTAPPARRHPARVGGERGEGRAHDSVAPAPREGRQSPGFVKEGHLERLDISVTVCLRKDDGLSASPQLGHIPHQHRLQQACTECPPARPPGLSSRSQRNLPCPPRVSADVCLQRGAENATTSGGEAPGGTPSFRDTGVKKHPSQACRTRQQREQDQSLKGQLHPQGRDRCPAKCVTWGCPARLKEANGGPCRLPVPWDGCPTSPPAQLPSAHGGPCQRRRAAPRCWRSCGQRRQSASRGLAPTSPEALHPPEGAEGVDRAPEQGQAAPRLEVPETQHAVGPGLGRGQQRATPVQRQSRDLGAGS